MAKRTQANNIYELLKKSEWVCVEDMTKLYIVDYRRRLVDLQKRGIELLSERCKLHKHHKGGSKMWRLKNIPIKQVVKFVEEADGSRKAVISFVPVNV